jgi:hypothetical protein
MVAGAYPNPGLAPRNERTVSTKGTSKSIHHILSGAGGSADLHQPSQPKYGSRQKAIADINGFVIIDLFRPPLWTQNTMLIRIVTVGRSTAAGTPTPTAWYDRWATKVEYRATPVAKAVCSTPSPDLSCTASAACTPASTPVATFTKTQCQGSGGCWYFQNIDTTPRPACPSPSSLMKAKITAAVCCGVSPCPPSGICCPVVATAFNCYGQQIVTICLNDYFPGGTYIGETACIFDSFTVPCWWEIRGPSGSSYRVACPITVQYYCCTCSGSYTSRQ